MAKTFDVLLLLALPASGKSEVRTYLKSIGPEQCLNDFHLGQTVQLDDFPYVHVMRRIDEELIKINEPGIFFEAPDKPFKSAEDWGTLIELLNEDYEDLISQKMVYPEVAAQWIIKRLTRARRQVGAPDNLSALSEEVRKKIYPAIEAEAAKILKEKQDAYSDSLEGKTVIMEFARGGAEGSSMPLESPFGYQYSLGQLDDEIIQKAAILYIWVTPEESRRKNEERADPNNPGSILHHGVPIEVMLKDYGCDDIDYLMQQSTNPNTIKIETRGKTFNIPIARFDNRVDKTTFIRKDKNAWLPEEIQAVHDGLKEAFTILIKNY
jgi:hypothetical protein